MEHQIRRWKGSRGERLVLFHGGVLKHRRHGGGYVIVARDQTKAQAARYAARLGYRHVAPARTNRLAKPPRRHPEPSVEPMPADAIPSSEVARRHGVHYDRLYCACYHGQIQAWKRPGERIWYWSESQVIAWLARQPDSIDPARHRPFYQALRRVRAELRRRGDWPYAPDHDDHIAAELDQQQPSAIESKQEGLRWESLEQDD